MEIDSNAILVESMKSCKDAEMIRVYNALLLQLKRAGIVPKKYVLDNGQSEYMKNRIPDMWKFDMELVPPGCHWRNAAEVAICNFKAHFFRVIACVAGNFPPNLWDPLLPQTKIMINLIWKYNATSNVLAYTHLSGPFDYNKMPLAPMGCEAQVHKKSGNCGTRAYHSVNLWYLFTLLEHYCTHNCHIKHTKSKWLPNTVQFQHKQNTNPSITHADKVMHALADCVEAIKGMTGKARTSQAAQDLQQIVDATQAHLQAHSNKFEETKTPTATRNMQWVPRVQAPPSVHTNHCNDNKRITCSMHPQPPVPRVLTNKPTSKPTSMLFIEPPRSLSENPPDCHPSNQLSCLPILPNVNAFWSSKPQAFAMQQHQPAQRLT